MERSAWIIGGLVAATLSGSAEQAAARNIFEDFSAAFFGAPPRQAQPRYSAPQPDGLPLEMTVRKPGEANRRGYPEASSKPVPPVVNLDPRTDPNWFLKDPTLRRGDIVVTNKGVLVFNGRGNVTRSDFASLGGKSGGVTWQRQLKAAATGGRSYFSSDGVPVTNKEATAR